MTRLDWLTLWDEARRFFSETTKTGWGKNEIVAKLDELEKAMVRRVEADEAPEILHG